MPELPDLQVFSRNLTKTIAGKTLDNVTVTSKKANVTPTAFNKALKGQTITRVYRDGKELRIGFGNGDVLGLHLMLHGNLRLFEGENTHRFTVFALSFSDGTGLALTDFQRQATPTLNPEERTVPDALDKSVNYKFLKTLLNNSKAAVKNVLLDQHNLRGIGNAYADEILWEARISPFSISNKIPDAHIKSLTRSIRKVLKSAEKRILKSHPDIIAGEVRDFMAVHNPRKEKSPGGRKIKKQAVGGRKTYFTDEQKLFK